MTKMLIGIRKRTHWRTRGNAKGDFLMDFNMRVNRY